MKTSNIAVWFFLLIVLGIAACGGSETVVSSSTANNTPDNTEQVDDNTDPIRLFDGPEDPNGGGGE